MLFQQERLCLCLKKREKSNKEIAKITGMNPKTIAGHGWITRKFNKLFGGQNE